MKKLSIIALIVLTVTSTCFAGDPTALHFKGAENFMKAFPQATEVNYLVKQKYTEVNFTWNSLKLQAFFDREGNLIGTSRSIAVSELPLATQMQLKERYAGYEAISAIEFDHADTGLSYYVTVENSERTYVLNVFTDGTIVVFKKMKK
jgi:hypothetical protein